MFARLISTSVARRVRLAGSLGPVHSAFRNAVNIASPDGLLTIATPATGALPNGLVLSADADLLCCVGAQAESNGDLLSIGALRIDVRHAGLWSPVLTLRGTFPPFSTLVPILREVPLRGGFSQLPDAVPRLVEAVRDECPGAAEEACRGLVGLGHGLTPSGDDVLIGFSAALRVREHPFATLVACAAADAAPGRTTDVAAMFHAYAARGEYSQRIATLLDRLLAGPTSQDIQTAAAWGAWSGADCLLGVLLGAYLDPTIRPC